MEHFWNGFEKRASSTTMRFMKHVNKVVGKYSKGGGIPHQPEMRKQGMPHKAPPIPGPVVHAGSAAAIPGEKAMVPGVRVPMKKAVQAARV